MKVLKRVSYEKPHSFKQEGNEVQATFNSRLDETLAQAECDITTILSDQATAPARQCVVESLCKSCVLIYKQQKLILLADCLEHFNHISF